MVFKSRASGAVCGMLEKMCPIRKKKLINEYKNTWNAGSINGTRIEQVT